MHRSRARSGGEDSAKKTAVAHARVHLNGVRALACNGLEQLNLVELHLIALETNPSDMQKLGAVVRALGNVRRAAHRLKLRDLYYYVEEQERRAREALEAGLIPETTIDSCLDVIDVLKRYLVYVEESLRTGQPLPSPRMLPALRRSVESLSVPMRAVPAVTPRDAQKRLGELLMESGDVTEGDLQRILFECEEAGPHQPIGELLLEELRISREQLNRALAEQARDPQHPLLGEILVHMGAVSRRGLNKTLERQRHPKTRRLGETLVRAGLVPAKRVVLALRSQGIIRDAVRHGLASLAARFAARATETGPPQQRNRLSADEHAALARFQDEARNLLNAADRNLLALESDAADPHALESVRRSIHALARFASYLGLADIGRFARAFSGYLARASDSAFPLRGPHLDVAFDCVEVLRRHVGYVDEALKTKGRIHREKQLPEYIAFLRALSAGRHKNLRVTRLQPPADGQRLGDILVASGMISREALDAVLAAQAQTRETAMLGELLVDEALVSRDQVDAALAAQQRNPSIGRLGDILVQWGLVDRADIEAAITRQRAQGRPRIGELLVRTGAVPAKAVAHALRCQRAGLAGTAAATLVASSILAPAPPADATAVHSAGDAAIVWVMDRGLAPDTDGDGLSDAVEAALGTHPLAPDTDRDGMLDGWEVWNALNPRNAADAAEDADNDFLTNGDEAGLGSQPFAVDSDGDEYWDFIEAERGTDPASSASHPVSRVYGDTNADDKVNASDIQYVINAALGLDTPVPTNINRVGAVDALDIQGIINAALGIAPRA